MTLVLLSWLIQSLIFKRIELCIWAVRVLLQIWTPPLVVLPLRLYSAPGRSHALLLFLTNHMNHPCHSYRPNTYWLYDCEQGVDFNLVFSPIKTMIGHSWMQRAPSSYHKVKTFLVKSAIQRFIVGWNKLSNYNIQRRIWLNINLLVYICGC